MGFENINPLEIIERYFNPGTNAHAVLIAHATAVAQKAVQIAVKMAQIAQKTDPNTEMKKPDIAFVREGAMLHDIGIFMTHGPEFGCFGKHPYIRHGVLGSRLLKKLGLFRHARVCESHVGLGLSVNDIIQNRLPLPVRDMLPETLEERIICYADKFFSKNIGPANEEKSMDRIISGLERFGPEKVKTFLLWKEEFGC